jgi:tetratricopeptide (TPR) repeat protein
MTQKTILTFFFFCCLWRLGAQPAVVTDAAALQLGHTIQNDDDVQRQSQLSHILDQTSFIARMTESCPSLRDSAFRRGFLETFLPSLPRIGASLGTGAIGGSYRLIREYDSGGVKHLLFRAFGKQGLNYHDYSLIKVRDSIKASDVFLYTTGEFFSQTMADLVTAMDRSQSPEKESEELKAITLLRDDYKQHKYLEAKSVYDGLNPTLRDSKAIQLAYISITQRIGDSLYEGALDHFRSLYPDAPNTYLLMLDLCYYRKEYQKGIEMVDKVDGMVGDTILNLYRGNFLKLSGKSDSAIGYYEKAYRFEPGFKMNTRTLIVTYAEVGRSQDAKRIIAEFRQQRSFRPEDLEDIYTAFPSLKD